MHNQREQYNTAYIEQKYSEVKAVKVNATGEKYALVLWNIKNFRYYNTKYGIDGANEILELVFQVILDILEEEEYAGYLGADNFVTLLQYEDIDKLTCHRLAQMAVEQLYRIDDARIYRNIFYSLGIYQLERDAADFGTALNFAGICRKESDSLYNRSTCIEVYDESFYAQYMERMDMEIKTADAYKNYEFIAYLQPKVDPKMGKVVGAEALLRWFDEEGNNISLYKFLPILDRNQYIKLVDLDIFDQMCEYLDKRIKSNKKIVPISFNMSKANFYNPDVFEMYVQIFEKYDIPKQYIEIEFMESISLNDTAHMQEIITKFKAYGFTCSLDDFGSGYSSFNVLLNAPLDIVKMDRQFFLNNLNGDGKLVIKTVVDLIHSLHMKVVAEGVETKEHIEYLIECDCDYVQGYYYYQPMSVEAFNKIMDDDNMEE